MKLNDPNLILLLAALTLTRRKDLLESLDRLEKALDLLLDEPSSATLNLPGGEAECLDLTEVRNQLLALDDSSMSALLTLLDKLSLPLRGLVEPVDAL